MKRSCTMIGLATLAIMCIGWQPAVWPQEKPGTVVDQLQGFWTLVLREDDGEGMMSGLNIMLPDLQKSIGSGPLPRMTLWKITKDEIQLGYEEDGKFVVDSRPGSRGVFELNAGNKAGAIDWFDLGKDGQKIIASRGRGLYDLKGNYLMVCWNVAKAEERPESFATQPKAKAVQRSVSVFRRGKLEGQGPRFIVRDKD
jgi:uncharacterized protein (TIGR03067 family)